MKITAFLFCLVTVALSSNFLVWSDQNFPVLSSTESLTVSSNRTIASRGGVFELGFFRHENRWYLGIWFSDMPIRIYVWVTNRDNPLSEPLGTLRISNSDLVLFDQSNNFVWSTNTTKEESQISPVVADLLEDGNFVLRHFNNEDPSRFLWQSFDFFPTDILLPQMKLGWQKRREKNTLLTSWKSPNDPSSGKYSFGIDIANQNPQLPTMFTWERSSRINRINIWNGASSLNIPVPEKQPVGFLTLTLTTNSEEVTFSFESYDKNFISIMRLTPTGLVQQLFWNKTHPKWDLIWTSPPTICGLYNYCGLNGYCDSTRVPFCNCMRGFEPKNSQAWASENWGEGCRRKTQLSCSKDKFFGLTDIKLPDPTNAVVDSEIGFDECEKRCLRDCNCTSFAISSREYCVIWTGELLDVEKYTYGGQILYVRLHGKKSQIRLILGLAATFGCLIIIVVIFCCWKRRSNRSREREPEHISREIITENLPNLELPMFSFETISVATNSFSDSNKIGSGGFGDVYQGILDGQDVAVKRLSQVSGQGITEFRNELELITKVRHNNLVQLLGYSVHGEEKLLVYEYLENRSLDHYLFDKTKSSELNWPSRYEIVIGIGRGISYLHHDSPTMIIHRNLKPSNVLLDKDMTPKISDFGMARIFQRGENEVDTKRVVGSYGYMSPEYSRYGTYSEKSDAFSFGVLLIEILTGRKIMKSVDGMSLLTYVFKKWKEGEWTHVIDPILDSSAQEVKRSLQIGLLCVQYRAEDRPIMPSVVVMLLSQNNPILQPNPPDYYHVEGSDLENASLSNNADSSWTFESGFFSLIEPR